MTKEKLRDKITDSFCKECQAIWLVGINDRSMTVFYSGENRIPNSIETALLMKSYDAACSWYIDNYVMTSQRERMIRQTSYEVVVEMTSEGKTYFVEYNRVNGSHKNYNQLCYDVIKNDEGEAEYIMLAFRDIDIRKKAEIDDLTGVYTRQVFFEKSAELMKTNPDEQFDIIISDIIDFKKINETYGVEKADEILRWIGSYIAPSMSDRLLIGRYGGDQIAMLGMHSETAFFVTKAGAQKWFEAERNNGLPPILVKFGAYMNIRHDRSIVSCCDKAHIALNSIKGKYDTVLAYYDEELVSELDKQRRIEKSMYDSLNNGDFKVYYQPKHDALSGRLVGAEALIRWIHPEYGFMSPADFIPLFERNGFIVENDRYVWKRTCENLRRWEDLGLRIVPISINASKLTLAKEDMLSHMQEAVRSNNISPKNLHVEITETLMTDDVDDLIRKLTALRMVGYQIELDDFGAGFSSINVLSTLPLDVVKLDMSFMQQFGDEKRSKVLSACIDLAKNLGYKTVSEGVEEKEQCDLLGILGVDMIQGYYYSKPLCEEDFEKYLLANA